MPRRSALSKSVVGSRRRRHIYIIIYDCILLCCCTRGKNMRKSFCGEKKLYTYSLLCAQVLKRVSAVYAVQKCLTPRNTVKKKKKKSRNKSTYLTIKFYDARIIRIVAVGFFFFIFCFVGKLWSRRRVFFFIVKLILNNNDDHTTPRTY